MIILFLGGDSLIAFKGIFLYCLGIYCMMFIKVMYQSPRPFWVTTEISSNSDHCTLSYASPSIHGFNTMFYLPYIIYMHLWKYNLNPNKLILAIVSLALVVYNILLILAMLLFGQIYIYQVFTTLVYCLIYHGICIIFDNEIMSFCEKLGFLKKTSRVLKFYLLFFIIGLYVIAEVVISDIDDVWVEN